MDDAVARDLLKLVGSWEGFEVVGVSEEANAAGDVFGLPAPRLVLVLQPTADHVKRCSTCGAPVGRVHDVSQRRVRDLPIDEWDTWLVFPRARVACARRVSALWPDGGSGGLAGSLSADDDAARGKDRADGADVGDYPRRRVVGSELGYGEAD